ncbi:MAG: hypothetical protein ACXVA9_01510 [Bdellovibrionales bacterium]
MSQPKPWQIDLAAGVKAPVDSSCVGIGDALEPEALLNFAVDSGLNHICQKTGHLFDEEIKSSNCIIESDQNFFSYPAGTILTPHDLSPQSERALIASDTTFTNSNQKQEILGNITAAVQGRALSQTILDDVIAVADEFFTNAIFNAPFVDMNTHKNPGLSRHSLEIKFEDGKQGRMFLAIDANRLVIGCEDPYGSLDLNRYLSKVRSTYQRGPAAAINFGPGGAGIGSYIIFNAGSSLYFGVWPGHTTLLCCVIPIGLSNRKRIQLSKHVHWIQR